MSLLIKAALVDPSQKAYLRKYYEDSFLNRGSFNDFWQNEMNRNLKPAPAFAVVKTDGVMFSSVAQKGKWILLDFWGTWCSPCVQEHPVVQKFYSEVLEKSHSKLEVLTVACKDSERKINDYMAKYHYTFPVVMDNEGLAVKYNVSVYPTKILITPQGKRLLVPATDNWVEFVKQYADL